MSALPAEADYTSGDPGFVTGPWRRSRRALVDAACRLAAAALASSRRADAASAAQPRRRVLVAGIYRPGSLMPAALGALHSDRHDVTLALGCTAGPHPSLAAVTLADHLGGGKFGNLNRVLEAAPDRDGFDWTLVLDDDLTLPPRFLDRLVALSERFDLDIAQPAQTWLSHSAWRVTRRRPGSLVRETRFVEIGPATAFRRPAAAELLPFPELRYGWGLDLHWAAVAAERGWRLGVVDAVPVRHETAPVAASYSHDDAIAEAAEFLAARPFLSSAAAGDTLAVHHRLPRAR